MLILLGFIIGIVFGWLLKFAFDYYGNFMEQSKKLENFKNEIALFQLANLPKKDKPM